MINLILVKNNESLIKEELEKIKKLLILQLSQSDISIPYVAKASGMSTKDIYKFIPKRRSRKKNQK